VLATDPRTAIMSHREDAPQPAHIYLKVPRTTEQSAEATSIREAAAAVQASPRFLAKKAQLLRVASRGTPALVFVEDALPNGEIARIYLGQKGALSRFIVVSMVGFRDDYVDQALMIAHAWELENIDDEGSTDATVYADGHYTITSSTQGRKSVSFRVTRVGDAVSGPAQSELLARAAAETPREVPGIGRARVVVLNGASEQHD
jgi:hypothetical protein